MKSSLKFSIIMPFYNSESYIDRAVLSVINQTYGHWELLAINDGSTDNSSAMVIQYSKKDNRIRVFSKENGGYSSAVNYGLDHLSNDSNYFMFLGSDDELDSTLLEKMNTKIQKSSLAPDIIGFRTTIINEENGTKMYDPETTIDEDLFFENTNLHAIYLNEKIPNIFILRDTSRLYKTKKLNGLRYFGKSGLYADSFFSTLFSCRCTSFALTATNGYIWHKRRGSVSGQHTSTITRLDILDTCNSFFGTIISNGGVLLPSKIYEYLDRFVYYYICIVHEPTTLFRGVRLKMKSYAKTIIKTHKLYNLRIKGKKKFVFMFPCFFNKYYNLVGKGLNKK